MEIKKNKYLKKLLNNLMMKALLKLYKFDYELIKNPIFNDDITMHNSERSIVFRFGIYLNNLIKNNLFLKGYNLDVEYNRNLDKIKEIKIQESTENYYRFQRVIPDLIIHKRGNNKNNLLIIEIKTWWNNNQEYDKRKIQSFLEQPYCYNYGVCIKINDNQPKILFI